MPKAKTASQGEATSELASERSIGIRKAPKGPAVFRLTGEFRKSSHGFIIYPKKRIDNQDVVSYVDENGRIRQRRMRLLRGIDSFWADEQANLDESLIEGMTPDIVFQDGVFRSPDDVTSEFLRNKNCCATNPNRMPGRKPWYYEVQPELTEEELYDLEVLRQKARNMAMEAGEDDMWYHADYLGIDTTSEVGEKVSPKGLRARYVKYAGEKPAYFMQTAGTSDLKYSYMIKRLIESNQIKVNLSSLDASWRTGTHISSLPENQAAQKYLARFVFTEEGRDFKKRLDDMDITRI